MTKINIFFLPENELRYGLLWKKTGLYIIAANDGKRDYILKFTYPDLDMTNDYNEIDYVVDCVYRFCSFSGGTYQPRSYQQFLDDNMGSKK